MAQPSRLAQLLNQRLTRFPSLDPGAVRAVAAQEGLGGGIGDNNTSFGPFQLHQGGAYPSSAPQDPAQAQQWAWSPQGIDYALGRIQTVAGGLHGPAAVSNIVSRFERPADIPGETSRAEAAYGGPVTGGQNFALPAVGGGLEQPAFAPSPRAVAAGKVSALGNQFALQLIGSAQQMLNGGTPNLSQLFGLAKGFQMARAQFTKTAAPLGGGTPLVKAAGGAL